MITMSSETHILNFAKILENYYRLHGSNFFFHVAFKLVYMKAFPFCFLCAASLLNATGEKSGRIQV